VQVVDPQQCRLVGLRGKKTDYRDCCALLTHLRTGSLVTVWRPDAQTRHIRQLTAERQAYNGQIVQCKNRLRALLRDEGLDSPRNLFTAEGEAWLAAQPLSAGVGRIVARQWAALQSLTLLKEGQEEELAQLALQLPAAQRLMQLVGCGPALAVMFLGEVGELTRFPSAKQLVSYGGLDPRVHQSGEHRTGGAVSKAGRRALRWLMVEMAWSHVHQGGPEAAFFHRLLAKGKPEGVAIVALARRLLELAYLLLTREVPYRRVEGAHYERKLARLAAHRAVSEEPEERQPHNQEWAAQQVEALTGLPSGYRAAHPVSRHRRRVARGRAAVAPAERLVPPAVTELCRRVGGGNHRCAAASAEAAPPVIAAAVSAPSERNFMEAAD
jgi:transposase